MRHPGADRQADPDAFQRVMVSSATGVASFELVQWLARQHGEDLVHRRFAGAEYLDVASDYVDFAHGERVVRAIAMARNGLLLPLTRAFLPDYSHIVLLLSGDGERDQALVQRMVQACDGVTSPPAMLAVAAENQHHARPYALARRCGHIYLSAVANPDDPAASWGVIEPLLDQWQLVANSDSAAVPLRRAAGQ